MATKDKLKENYDENIKELERQRTQSLADASRENELIMKYMPEKMAQMGNKNTGLAESSLLQAYGNYANRRADISNQFASAKNDLYNQYQSNLLPLQEAEDEENRMNVQNALSAYQDKGDYLGGLKYLESNKDLFGSNYKSLLDNYLLESGYNVGDTSASIEEKNRLAEEERARQLAEVQRIQAEKDATKQAKKQQRADNWNKFKQDMKNELSSFFSSLKDAYNTSEFKKGVDYKTKGLFDEDIGTSFNNAYEELKNAYEGSSTQDAVEFIGELFKSAGLMAKDLSTESVNELKRILKENGYSEEEIKEAFKNMNLTSPSV